MLRAFNLPMPFWEIEETEPVLFADNAESSANLDLGVFNVEEPEISSEEAISRQEETRQVVEEEVMRDLGPEEDDVGLSETDFEHILSVMDNAFAVEPADRDPASSLSPTEVPPLHHSSPFRSSCVAHTGQLVVKDGFNSVTADMVIAFVCTGLLPTKMFYPYAANVLTNMFYPYAANS